MIFFNKNKLKIRKEYIKNYVKFYIQYYKIEESTNFKIRFLSELLGNNSCLALIDTSLSYSKSQMDKKNSINELMSLISILGLESKKLVIKSANNVSCLGDIIKLNRSAKNRDYIVGFIISKENLSDIKPILTTYNIHYYINSSGYNKEDLLNKVQIYHDGEEEDLYYEFDCSTFDYSFIQNMVIYSIDKKSQFINDIINKFV